MLRPIIAVLFLLILVAAGAYWAGRRSVATPPAPNEAAPGSPEVAAGKVIVSGTVRVGDPVNIFPDTSGILQSLHVRQGDPVREGDLLAIVRNEAFDVTEQRLAREYQALVARVEDLEKVVARSRIEAARLRAEVETSRSRLERVRLEAARQEELFRAGAVARQKYQQSQRELEAAETRNSSVEAILKTAESELTIQEQNLNAAKLLLEDKRAEWEAAKGDVDLGEVLAPLEGTIVEITSVEGQTVSPNAEPLMRIAPVESQRFAIIVPNEEQMRRIRVGQPATIRPQVLSDVHEIPGRVNAFRGNEVLVEFTDLENRLPPGSQVQVEIDTTGEDIAAAGSSTLLASR